MCQYCGCPALPAIADLTREHDAMRELAREARLAAAAGDLPAAQAVVHKIAVLLAPHTAVEERALFPAMTAEHPDDVEMLAQEHEAIDRAFMEFQANPPADWSRRLEQTLLLLSEHILAEQDGLFPAALAILNPEDWDAVDAVRVQVGTALLKQV